MYIWTDLIPLIIFIIIDIYHINTVHFINADNRLKLLEYGVLIGITFCRFTSTFYHIFNCVNLWTSRYLIQVDLIGIATTCLVSPYFYILGNNSANIIYDQNFINYCIILFTFQGLATLIFLSNMIIGETKLTSLIEQPLLCLLAALGNYSGIRILFFPNPSFILKAHCATSILFMVLGYVIFFLCKFPERLLASGASDAKIWNSHSLWHLSLFIAQLSLLSVPVLYS